MKHTGKPTNVKFKKGLAGQTWRECNIATSPCQNFNTHH